VLNLILEAIDKINIITSQGFLASFLAGDETGQSWDLISTYLYQLLAAIIKGNHTNCAQFANSTGYSPASVPRPPARVPACWTYFTAC